MPYRKNEFVKGHYYHIFNRGINHQNIFFSEENNKFCLRLIKKYSKKYSVTVIAYCLMPNHYHFLLRQDDDFQISQFMRTLFNSYVQAVNKMIGRSGSLFEGRFKHVLVDNHEYLVHLIRYIHFNPVEARIITEPVKYIFSNYLEWIGERNGTIVDREFITDSFPDTSDYKKFATEYQIEKQLMEKLSQYFLD